MAAPVAVMVDVTRKIPGSHSQVDARLRSLATEAGQRVLDTYGKLIGDYRININPYKQEVGFIWQATAPVDTMQKMAQFTLDTWLSVSSEFQGQPNKGAPRQPERQGQPDKGASRQAKKPWWKFW